VTEVISDCSYMEPVMFSMPEMAFRLDPTKSMMS